MIAATYPPRRRRLGVKTTTVLYRTDSIKILVACYILFQSYAGRSARCRVATPDVVPKMRITRRAQVQGRRHVCGPGANVRPLAVPMPELSRQVLSLRGPAYARRTTLDDMKVTRRQIVPILVASAAVPAAAAPQADSTDSTKRVREQFEANAQAMASVKIPMTTEPPFHFKA